MDSTSKISETRSQPIYLPVQWASDTEAIITRWYCLPEESFVAGEILAEAETVDAVFPVQAPTCGVMLSHTAREGDVVNFAQPIGRISPAEFSGERTSDSWGLGDDFPEMTLDYSDWN